MRYIMIMEDGETYKADHVTDEDMHQCDSGVLDIIDTEKMKKYYEGEWHDLIVWGEW